MVFKKIFTMFPIVFWVVTFKHLPKYPQIPPSNTQKNTAKICWKVNWTLKIQMLVSPRFLEVLEGLEGSGRLLGTISSYFRRNQTSWCRVLTKEQERLTIKKRMTTSMWAYQVFTLNSTGISRFQRGKSTRTTSETNWTFRGKNSMVWKNKSGLFTRLRDFHMFI